MTSFTEKKHPGPEGKAAANEEQPLAEIERESNEKILESIESAGIPRNSFFAWLDEHGIDW